MDVLYCHCAGLDVPKKTVVACRLSRDAHGHPVREITPCARRAPLAP